MAFIHSALRFLSSVTCGFLFGRVVLNSSTVHIKIVKCSGPLEQTEENVDMVLKSGLSNDALFAYSLFV